MAINNNIPTVGFPIGGVRGPIDPTLLVQHDNSIVDPAIDGNGNIVDTDKSDLIATLGGDDKVTITVGNDEVHAGDGNDTIVDKGAGFDELFGDKGNDTFDIRDASGNNHLFGGEGDDSVTFSGLRNADGRLLGGEGVNVDLETGKAFFNVAGTGPSDSIDGVENVTGTFRADKITGDEHNNVLSGGFGADSIDGGAGNDQVLGGDGNDVLTGGAGRDLIDGGRGIDTASFETATAGVRAVLGEPGSDGRAITGTGSDDVDVLRNIEDLTGSRFADDLSGNSQDNEIRAGSGDDLVHGGRGNDELFGDRGNDKLFGDAGNDELHGGRGNDLLVGGAGGDILEGGSGSDTFRFDSKTDSAPQTGQFDTIKDFDIHNDVLDLSGIDADEGRAGNQAFQLVDQQFAGGAGTAFISFEVDANGQEHTLLQGFTNNTDSVPDFVISFDGHIDLNAAEHVNL